MIVQETYSLSGRDFVRTYSDENRSVVRDGVSYTEANDPAELGRTYTEGDLLPEEERTDLSDKAEAYDILMGVSE